MSVNKEGRIIGALDLWEYITFYLAVGEVSININPGIAVSGLPNGNKEGLWGLSGLCRYV